MENVVSAGTVVAAILETAGFVTHAEILDWFDNLWFYGGGFFYTLAIIGGIFSVAIFGSYRYARYLILGPALFYFMVCVRSDASPVVYKVGGADSQSVEPYFTRHIKGFKQGEEIPVSWFFHKVSILSATISNGMSEIILANSEDKKGEQVLLAQARNKMLQFFLNAHPQDEEFFEMMSDLMFGECKNVADITLALSHSKYTPGALAQISRMADGDPAKGIPPNPDAAEVLASHLKQRQALKVEHARLTKQLGKKPSAAMIQFIKRKTQGPGAPEVNRVLGSNYYQAFRQSTTNTVPEFLANDLPNMTTSCEKMWAVAQHAVMEQADWLLDKIGTDMMEEAEIEVTSNNAAALCRTIARKMTEDFDKGECDLVQTVGVFILRQMVLGQSLSEQASRAHLRARIGKSVKDYKWLDNLGGGDEDQLASLSANQELELRAADDGTGGNEGRVITTTAVQEMRDGKEVVVKNNDGSIQLKTHTTKWRPVFAIEARGKKDIGWGIQQQIASRNLRQRIYTHSMKLPYYQGVMLYFLAIAFPFFSLLLLIPSRAMAFLYLPLSIFWIHTWEIGFSIVFVLDRVLFELLPRTDLPYNAFDVANATMPDILGAALAVDPSYDIHAHYNFISIALVSVPPITGWIVLKGKSSVLATFTVAPIRQSNQSGEMAADRFSLGKIAELNAENAQYGGLALASTGQWGEGIGGNGRIGGSILNSQNFGMAYFGANATSTALKAASGVPRNNARSGAGGGTVGPGGGGPGAGGAGSPLVGAGTRSLMNDQSRNHVVNAAQNLGMDLLNDAVTGAEKGNLASIRLLLADQKASAVSRRMNDAHLGRQGFIKHMRMELIAGADPGNFEIDYVTETAKDAAAAYTDVFLARMWTGEELARELMTLEMKQFSHVSHKKIFGNMSTSGLTTAAAAMELLTPAQRSWKMANDPDGRWGNVADRYSNYILKNKNLNRLYQDKSGL